MINLFLSKRVWSCVCLSSHFLRSFVDWLTPWLWTLTWKLWRLLSQFTFHITSSVLLLLSYDNESHHNYCNGSIDEHSYCSSVSTGIRRPSACVLMCSSSDKRRKAIIYYNNRPNYLWQCWLFVRLVLRRGHQILPLRAASWQLTASSWTRWRSALMFFHVNWHRYFLFYQRVQHPLTH